MARLDLPRPARSRLSTGTKFLVRHVRVYAAFAILVVLLDVVSQYPSRASESSYKFKVELEHDSCFTAQTKLLELVARLIAEALRHYQTRVPPTTASAGYQQILDIPH